MTRKTEPTPEPSPAPPASERDRLDAMRVLPEPPAPLRADGELDLPSGLQALAEQLNREAHWLHGQAPAPMALRGAEAAAERASGRTEKAAAEPSSIARLALPRDSGRPTIRLWAAATRLVPLAAACALAWLAIGPLSPPAPAPRSGPAGLPALPARSGLPGPSELSERPAATPAGGAAPSARQTAEGDTPRPRLIDLLENLNGPEFEAVMDLLENEESQRGSTETVIAI